MLLFCAKADTDLRDGRFAVSVTQPAVSGPFSCFDASRGGPGQRALEVDLGDDVDNGGGGGGGYLSSAITDRTGAGSAGCPWLLRASPWQRINVSLIDFSDAASLDARPDAFGYSIVLGETGHDPRRRLDVDELSRRRRRTEPAMSRN